jgi:hypothetical protein
MTTDKKKLTAWVDGFTKAANALGIHDTAAVNGLLHKCVGLMVANGALEKTAYGPLGLVGRLGLIGGGLLGGKALFDSYASNNATNFEPGGAMHTYGMNKRFDQANSRAGGLMANEALAGIERQNLMSPEARSNYQFEQSQRQLRERMRLLRSQSAADRELASLRNPRYTPQTWLGAGTAYGQQAPPTGLW